jgi:hypothetical protein
MYALFIHEFFLKLIALFNIFFDSFKLKIVVKTRIQIF